MGLGLVLHILCSIHHIRRFYWLGKYGEKGNPKYRWYFDTYLPAAILHRCHDRTEGDGKPRCCANYSKLSTELPDFDAFTTTVLRELNYLQTPRVQQQQSFTHSFITDDRSQSDLESDSDLRVQQQSFTHFSITDGRSQSDLDSDSDLRSVTAVWTHRPITSYAATDTETDREINRLHHFPRSLSPTESLAISNGAGENDPRTVPIDELSDLGYHSAFNDDDLGNDHSMTEEGGFEHPSLGYLDEALSFIAAERERWNAQREANVTSGDVDISGTFLIVMIYD